MKAAVISIQRKSGFRTISESICYVPEDKTEDQVRADVFDLVGLDDSMDVIVTFKTAPAGEL